MDIKQESKMVKIKKTFYKNIGVESKINGKFDKKEKEMATWLLDNKIFSKIYIAYPIKKGRKTVVAYKRFER